MKFSPHYLKRYKDIAVLLMKYGQPRQTSRFQTEAPAPTPTGKSPESAQKLPDDLERLGPTFVKLGQLLSSRPDLVPEKYLQPLSRLQDNVKPFPFEQVRETVEAELGTKINKAFCEFEQEPLAAASLGQVHCALLHDGRPVVVKVQRPGVGKQIEEDFAALRQLAEFFNRHTRVGQKYQFERVLGEFENTLANEMDYRREASNLTTLAENLAEFDRLRVPVPIANYCTRRVLTMEYIEGTKITELPPLARLDIEGGALAEELFRAYLKQILVDGIFHADPHPGNILLTTDNRIALIDLGMVGHTTPAMQENLLKLLLAVSEGQSEEAADVAVRISEASATFDESQFRHAIGQLVAEQHRNKLSDIDVGRVVLEVARTAGDTGLYVPTELSLLGKTLMQLDEVGRALAPAFDPNESVRRNASAILSRRLKSVFTEGKAYSTVLEAKEFLEALPTRLNKILDALGNAELNVNVKPSETEFLIDSARKVANRITTGIVLASLIVGAALLMRVPTKFQIFGYPGLAMLCFLAAATGGLWLVLNIVWQDHKSKQQSRR